jgi:hypothetical protein
MLASVTRSTRTGVWLAVLAALLVAPAAIGARRSEAPAVAPAAPARAADSGEDGSAPPDVASLDPIEECASVAPRVEKIRQPPKLRAPEDLLSRRSARRAPAHPTPLPRSGCAEVARWCLAHATSTSTP